MTLHDEIVSGSVELGDAQRESFATKVARGVQKLRAYKEAFGDMAEDGDLAEVSVRSRATRLSQVSEVRDRIHFLRRERDESAAESLPDRWDARSLADVAVEATHALRDALRVCEADPSVPESARSAIRREAVRHAGRVHRAGAREHDHTLPRDGKVSAALAETLRDRLTLCTCGTGKERG
ncbi:hypothetical protein [Salipiger abyssi]|uniref:hypothetical protein n=1 Tax=Salipiger abyssi TaxID=1250539 RepID=UPI0009766355|nr:hypothetical protein [Salipiger abyssi]